MEERKISKIAQESFDFHREKKGKIEVISRVEIKNQRDLSLAYTPGVAEPCLRIQEDVNLSYDLTRRGNICAVITDGTAVLGLGDIGPEAGMPVMEGKCALFKAFGDVDAFPICVKSKDVDEIVNTIYLISGSFGGVNLEDIAAPRCFEIEKKLKEKCDIPIFHDDQHGTAIVTGAALINAAKCAGKKLSDLTVVISGAGAAGCAVGKFLLDLGIKDLIMSNSKGLINHDDEYNNDSLKEMQALTNKRNIKGTLADALKGADVFVGLSRGGLVSKEMVASMDPKAIVMPMANPIPEIDPELAKEAGAFIIGTGRSDYPNQINNVLAFPGIFRGAFDVRARDINDEMQKAAAYAIASLVSDEELNPNYIIPAPFDPRVGKVVAKAVSEAAIKTKVARI